MLKEDQKVILEVKTINAKNALSEVKETKAKVIADQYKIDNQSFGPGENQTSVQINLDIHRAEHTKAQDKLEKCSEDLFTYADEVKKNEVFDFIWDLIDNYKVFLDTIALDQKVALINLIGFFTLLNTSITIFLILFGNEFLL